MDKKVALTNLKNKLNKIKIKNNYIYKNQLIVVSEAYNNKESFGYVDKDIINEIEVLNGELNSMEGYSCKIEYSDWHELIRLRIKINL